MNDELHHSENLFNEENSLLDLAFAFASDEYPNLDVDGYKSEIRMMGKGIQLPHGKDLEMKVKAFMRVRPMSRLIKKKGTTGIRRRVKR